MWPYCFPGNSVDLTTPENLGIRPNPYISSGSTIDVALMSPLNLPSSPQLLWVLIEVVITYQYSWIRISTAQTPLLPSPTWPSKEIPDWSGIKEWKRTGYVYLISSWFRILSRPTTHSTISFQTKKWSQQFKLFEEQVRFKPLFCYAWMRRKRRRHAEYVLLRCPRYIVERIQILERLSSINTTPFLPTLAARP